VHGHSFSNIILKLSSDYHCAWLKSYARPSLGVWVFAHPIIPTCRMAFDIFSLKLHQIGLPPSHGSWSFQCICGQAIDWIGIHLFRCVHWGKHTATHDAIQDFSTSIARDVGFHVLHKQTHVLPMPSLQLSQWQVDIVFTTNGIHTLVNVDITNPIFANLVLQVNYSWGVLQWLQLKQRLCYISTNTLRIISSF
jgi:hypothetical protein